MTDDPFATVGFRGNPNGYTFKIGNGGPQPIGLDGFGGKSGGFADGPHQVWLLGVRPPCTSNSPQAVTFTPHVV